MIADILKPLQQRYAHRIQWSDDTWSDLNSGWIPLLDKFLEKVSNLEGMEEFRIRQVKQKMGQLVVYYAVQPEHYRLIVQPFLDEAKNEASCTCEICGESGTLRTNLPYLQVLCSDHAVTDEVLH